MEALGRKSKYMWAYESEVSCFGVVGGSSKRAAGDRRQESQAISTKPILHIYLISDAGTPLFYAITLHYIIRHYAA